MTRCQGKQNRTPARKPVLLNSLLPGLLLLLSTPVHAYVGPGAGLGMLGSLIGVVLAALLSLLGLVVIPLRMWFKRRKAQKPHGQDDMED